MLRGNFFCLHKRFLALGLTFLLCLVLTGCGSVETDIRGKTMGTLYRIKLITSRWDRPGHLPALIEARLEEINASMSTYIADSEISRFNKLPAHEPFSPSPDFLEVMRVARDIHNLSQGAWDGTLDPLVTLWGFGRDGQKEQVPTQQDIDTGLSLVNFNRVTISADGTLIKQNALTIDLASIAKGYGVDAIATLLKEQGYENFLIEIGGEIFTSGKKNPTTPWRVGINTPSRTAGLEQVYKILSVEGKAVATSGDYRNAFVRGGRTYSHVLDPRTGYPVTNNVVSVSVVAATCTFADGLATALMVMGPDSGIKLVEQLEDVETLIIVRGDDGELHEYASSGFNTYAL